MDYPLNPNKIVFDTLTEQFNTDEILGPIIHHLDQEQTWAIPREIDAENLPNFLARNAVKSGYTGPLPADLTGE